MNKGTNLSETGVPGKMRRILSSSACAALVITSTLSVSTPAFAAPEDDPGAFEMTADALVARPFGLALTTLGAAAFVVSLPFSALGGNVKEAADNLVVGPGKATFVRCLGCKTSGKAQKARD